MKSIIIILCLLSCVNSFFSQNLTLYSDPWDLLLEEKEYIRIDPKDSIFEIKEYSLKYNSLNVDTVLSFVYKTNEYFICNEIEDLENSLKYDFYYEQGNLVGMEVKNMDVWKVIKKEFDCRAKTKDSLRIIYDNKRILTKNTYTDGCEVEHMYYYNEDNMCYKITININGSLIEERHLKYHHVKQH